MFDFGAFSIADDFSLIGIPGTLRVHVKHALNLDYIRYHREHYSKG
jgi:putative restriction endonuclease